MGKTFVGVFKRTRAACVVVRQRSREELQPVLDVWPGWDGRWGWWHNDVPALATATSIAVACGWPVWLARAWAPHIVRAWMLTQPEQGFQLTSEALEDWVVAEMQTAILNGQGKPPPA